MEKLKLLVPAFFLLMISCEEVIEVELDESAPRLVVEASLLWQKGTEGNFQVIKLTTTAPYFDDGTPPAENALVSVTSETGEIYNFEEIDPGIYANEQFAPEINKRYELSIVYQDETYTAMETLIPVSELQFIEQNSNGGFGGEDTELKIYYNDPEGVDNYYLFRFLFDNLSIQISEDEFTDGNLSFAYFSSEDLNPGEEVGFEIQGISERFYEYIFILRSQAGTNGGGPFQTQPTTVRGNIVNITNPENFAFGYFRASETDFLAYTIE